MLGSAPKPRACEYCGKDFVPFQSMQKVCSTLKCARGYVKKLNAVRTKEWRERKAALQTIPELIKEADKAFSAYIRLRDRLAGHACISSGRPLDWSGNKVDAGHYRSRGAASHLRYHEDNCHAQTKLDNQWKAGNVVEYRIRLIQRIGVERVEALEQDNEPCKWTREKLLDVIATYKAKKKELEKEKHD